MSNEQLADFSLPSRPNWKGPFFESSPQEKLGHPRMPTGSVSDVSPFLPHPSHVGIERSWNGMRDKNTVGAQNYTHDTVPESSNPASTQVMIALMNRVKDYAAGHKSDGMTRLGPPPPWAIDTSAEGAKSFFEADWGNPPTRLGRDPRYRPLLAEEVPRGRRRFRD